MRHVAGPSQGLRDAALDWLLWLVAYTAVCRKVKWQLTYGHEVAVLKLAFEGRVLALGLRASSLHSLPCHLKGGQTVVRALRLV